MLFTDIFSFLRFTCRHRRKWIYANVQKHAGYIDEYNNAVGLFGFLEHNKVYKRMKYSPKLNYKNKKLNTEIDAIKFNSFN